jgi:replicative DNA helicase
MSSRAQDAVPAVHNIGAEQALIGCVLRRDAVYFDVHNDISSTDFYDIRHRLIWETIGKIAAARKGRFNVATISDFLRSDDGTEAVSRDYLEALLAAAVVDLARTRRMIVALREAERRLMHRDPEVSLSEVAEAIHADVLDAGRMSGVEHPTLAGYAEKTYLRLDAINNGRVSSRALRWGLKAMDDACGPATHGHLTVIGGRPEMGKTALALGVALSFASQEPGAFIELEMSGEGMADRAMSRLTNIPGYLITRGEAFDLKAMSRMADALCDLHGLPLYMVARKGLNIRQIRERMIGLNRRHGCRWFIIDHLQIIGKSYRRQDDSETIDEASKVLVNLAAELDAVVVVLSQVNSKNRDRDYDRPQPRDLMFYNSIEPHADLIIFPYRPEVALRERRPPQPVIGDKKQEQAMTDWKQALDAARNRAEIIVGKNRHGESGIWRDCDWNGEMMRFEALTWDREQARARERANQGSWV